MVIYRVVYTFNKSSHCVLSLIRSASLLSIFIYNIDFELWKKYLGIRLKVYFELPINIGRHVCTRISIINCYSTSKAYVLTASYCS